MLAVLFITTEYRRGLIRTSLTASPRCGRVLAAKAVVIAAITFVAGLVGAAAAVPLGEHLLTANGNFIAPVTTLTWLRVVAGTAGLLAVAAVLALIALLSLGIATLVRDPAAAIGIVLGLLYLFPILLHVVTDPTWQRHLQQIAPSTAGLAIPSHHWTPRPAHQPVGRTRRTGSMGYRSTPRRCRASGIA